MPKDPQPSWRDRSPHAFPFLISLLTVTALAASNPYAEVDWRQAVVPLYLAFFGTLVVWAVSGLFVRDRLQRSLISVVFTLPLLLSGYLFAWLRTSDWSAILTSGLEVTFATLIAVVGILFVRRVRATATEAPRFLNLFGLLALIFTAPAVIRNHAVVEGPATSGSTTVLPDREDVARPDIYVIVLDAYTGAATLKNEYGFDNSYFLTHLEDRGFSIPKQSWSNYPRTFLSLGTMLNREYVPDRLLEGASGYRDRSRAYHWMEFNRTLLDVKELGYSVYYVGSSYPPLATNGLADQQYSTEPSEDFTRYWLRKTIVPPTLYLYCVATRRCGARDLPFQPETATETNERLEYLTSLVEKRGPKFVYAHVLLPHGPYRFGAKCGVRQSRWSVGLEPVRDDPTLRSLYIEQLQCTNQKVLQIVDAIQQDTTYEPVIILQSDHGNGRFVADNPPNLAEVDESRLRERFDVFAAYTGPAGVGDSLALHSTPVNVFRTLFRVLWEVDEPPLDDRHYWSERDQPLLLSEITLDGRISSVEVGLP